MPYISRTILPRYRITVPSYLTQAVQPVYLGMPPLPIGTLRPLSAPGVTGAKEVKPHATTSINGISNGSVKISSNASGTKAHRKRGKGSAIRTNQSGYKIRGISNTIGDKRSSKRTNRSKVARGPGGKFLPKKKA